MSRMRFLRRGFIVFLSVLIAFYNVNSVFALSGKYLDTFSQNNILFYDPEDGCQVDGMYTSKPSGDQITWIGDSYSVGAESKIEAKLPGVDLDGVGSPRNIQSGKRFGYDISGDTAYTDYTNHRLDSDNPSGLTVLDNLAKNNKLRKYIVFALGTNDDIASGDMEKLVDEMVNIGGDSHTYILITPRTYLSSYGGTNDGIRSAASKHNSIIIADWASAVEKDLNKYFDAVDFDSKTHPNSEGYDLFVDTIYNALPGGSVGTLAGNTNEEKIWNYFATAGIPGVSDNAAAIAGILGNLKIESNDYDPLAWGDIYYGLWMNKDPEFKKYVDAAGLGDYWGKVWVEWSNGDGYWSSEGTSQDIIDRAISVELDFLTKENERFYSASYSFVKSIDKVSNKTPESYAELFEVTVEGAYDTFHSSRTYIEDAGVRDHAIKVWGFSYYQMARDRKEAARDVFDRFSGSSSQTVVASQSNSSSSFVWEDGWLVDGMPGLIKEDVSNDSGLGETIRSGYGTSDGKPNKILLHNTEGTSNGYGAYDAGNKFPAHFIIDLKKKEAYQNLSIKNRALATAASDDSTIQIEIVGFYKDKESSYYLQNFTANEWDYLAVLLAAISQETGIPLTTSMNWDDSQGNIRATDREDFRNNVRGIVGHMHSPPDDDHTDPGNIWPFVEAAIARNPDASRFGGNANYNGCSEYSGINSSVGKQGLTYDQAKQLAINYGTNKNDSTKNQIPVIWDYCSPGGRGSNCSSFSAFFINKFSSKNVGDAPGDGWEVVGTLRGLGVPTGKEPRTWSIFSWSDGSTGHTGVVVGYENGEWIVVHASCNRGKSGISGPGDGTEEGGGSAFVFKNSDIVTAVWGVSNGLEFAYLENELDIAAISRYLSTGE